MDYIISVWILKKKQHQLKQNAGLAGLWIYIIQYIAYIVYLDTMQVLAHMIIYSKTRKDPHSIKLEGIYYIHGDRCLKIRKDPHRTII